MNSEWHDWRGSGRSEDRLEKYEWIREWLDEHKLEAGGPPDKEELEALKGLRRLMQEMVRCLVSGAALTEGMLDEFNRVLAEEAVLRRLVRSGEAYRLEHETPSRSWVSVMAETAASFAGILADGDPTRIRICENRDCRWIYYDDTRNRSKRYCDDKLCGNLMKVRRFRARKKAEAAGEGGAPRE
nr:CGNR zinc finger domain-containing protein [Paenibacillus caseinilyticus]